MLGINYNTQAPTRRGDRREGASSTCERSPGEDEGAPAVPARIARYALGSADYHDVIREKLRKLAAFVRREAASAKARGIVDTAPLLEREFARLAGLGWFGKNTMLINKRLGSWLFLAALLVDIELEYDEPHAASHCGTCTRCLDACPTQAFVEPYVLDARRCISYLTIEHRGPIPEELHAGMGDWLFGCDICQDVCPWNRKAPVSTEPAFQPQPGLQSVDAAELLTLTEDDFRERFSRTALARPGHEGLVRNARIVSDNVELIQRGTRCVP
jgi:epoxyqueuosine reductase